MVWFQCENCGENLKKPKLQNHFRGCAARKLSCIDCGVVFDQQSVQAHTSCVTETEKYGPKDRGQGSNGSAQIHKSPQVQKSGDVDLSIGLSTHPPWNCSLCKVNATSYETLEGHSQGKKHRSKAKASQAAQAAQAKLNSVPTGEQDVLVLNSHSNGSVVHKTAETNGIKQVENGVPAEEERNAKRRRNGLASDEAVKELGVIRKNKSKDGEVDDTAVEEVIVSCKNGGSEIVDELEHGEVTRSSAPNVKAVKWRKLISKALSEAPEGSMKLKKLVKQVLPLVVELGADASNKKMLKTQLLEKVTTSSKFEFDGRLVRLARTS